MGRPKLNPVVKYANVIPLWESAEMISLRGVGHEKPLVRKRCESVGHAIALVHRLNSCRASIREGGYHKWDELVVRRSDEIVTIWLKPPFDWTNITDGDGNPIDPIELERTRAMPILEVKDD